MSQTNQQNVTTNHVGIVNLPQAFHFVTVTRIELRQIKSVIDLGLNFTHTGFLRDLTFLFIGAKHIL